MSGMSYFKKIGGTMLDTMRGVYPTHDWAEWKFQRTNPQFWATEGNRRKCMEYVGKEIGIHQLSDWYQITVREVHSKGGS
jgi:hypothetical protein